MVTDDAASELYVADGYGNRRVVVFDCKTGAYKRHWGAYGARSRPTTSCRLQAGRVAELSIVLQPGALRAAVARRPRLRVRPRQRPHPGVQEGRHVREGVPARAETLQNGSVWDLVLSEDAAQRYIFVADGANIQSLMLDRQTGKVLGSFGRPGRMAGEFKWVHNMAIDSKGNLYTAEVGTGRRAQKFARSGRSS